MLRAVPGPEPEFDTEGLGSEQVWLEDDLSRGSVQPHPRVAADGYPVVHDGTIAMETDSDLRVRLLRSWQVRGEGLPVSWCTSMPQGGGCGCGENGEAGISSGPDGLTVDLLVPGRTAVAALTVDGEPATWQRPRGRTVVFSWEAASQDYTVIAYDAAGTVIAEYSGDLPPN